MYRRSEEVSLEDSKHGGLGTAAYFCEASELNFLPSFIPKSFDSTSENLSSKDALCV
jgi:hypothetical protein